MAEGTAVDYEMLRATLEQAIPFNVHNGVEVVEVGPGWAVARLPDRAHLRNHVGTVHGGALFAVAEVAAGAAFVGAVGERMAGIRLTARGATIDYERFATGAVIATSALDEHAGAILDSLARDGRLDLSIAAEVHDEEGARIARLTFRFYLKEGSWNG